MWYLLSISLTLVICTTLAQHKHGDGHGDDQEHHDYFHEVQEFFEISNETAGLPFKETTHLIRHMLYRLNCVSSTDVDCTACLNTTTVLQYLNRTDENSLDEEAFHKLSVILVVFMRDLHTECPNSQVTLGPGGRPFDEFLEHLAEDSHHEGEEGHHEGEAHVHVDMHILEGILHDISEHHSIGALKLDNDGVLMSGPTVNYNERVRCITPESIFEELGMKADGALHGEELEELSALIVSHILQGYCLSPEGLPAQESFLASIYIDYGDKTTGEINPESFAKLLGAMSIGGEEAHAEDEHGHEHSASRKKRDVGLTSVWRSKRETGHSAHPTHDAHAEGHDVSANCYSSEQLLKVFLDNSSANIDPSSFLSICPSIVQQILSGSCGKEEEPKSTSTRAQAYGYGTLAVFIITLCTLLGALFVTIKSPVIKRRILSFMMSLAIGTLLGDPALHLIPEAAGMHKHEHGHEHDDTTIEIEPYVWKMTALLASFYVFLVIELLLNKSPGIHSHSQDLELEPSKEMVENDNNKKPMNRALVLMICIGDGLHNFADGMAIGAAFSLSVSGGVSTSLAIFCHELPHELGDFAALLGGGLSVKKAMIMNFISGCTAFIGLYVGLAVGESEEGRVWIFILAAGMFIYVALADLVPEVMSMFKSAPDSAVIFFCINAGVLLGFIFMFIIAVFEKNIRV